MRSLVPFALLAAPALLAACGPTCAQTCERYLAETECDAAPDAISVEEALAGCNAQCNRAMATPGPRPADGDPRFNPGVAGTFTGDPSNALRNDQEAAAWMDCVWSFTDLAECRRELSSDVQACVPVFTD